MSNAAAQLDSFFQDFKNNEAKQTEYSKDPIAFLKNSALPDEYKQELIANLQEVKDLQTTITPSADYKHMSGYVREKPLLTGPAKGKPKISLQKTTNKWHWVTGYYLVLNNQATDDISDGLLAGATLTGLIAAANPEVISKTVAAGLAAALFAEGSAMKIVNRGRGVYYYLNPLLIGTPALFLSLVPLPN